MNLWNIISMLTIENNTHKLIFSGKKSRFMYSQTPCFCVETEITIHTSMFSILGAKAA